MIRLLVGLGASLDAPSPGGSTPLSVAVCWEQQEAAKLLLQLGADPNQVLPAHVNSGCYPMWSDSYSAEEAHTLLGMACSRIEFRDHLTLLLEAGADPSLAHPKTGLTPAAEACSIGALEEAALLIQLTAAPEGPWSLDQLGWAQALAEAAGNYFWNHATYPDAALEPLLEAWRQQPAPPPAAPPPAACRAVVAALLAHPVLQLAEGATTLQAGAELAGVLQAECLATVGISADLTARLRTSACTSVVLAAAPAATRWSPATHRYFPPAFKQAVRLLLLTNHRLLAQSRSSGAGAGVGSSAGSGAGSGRGGRHVGAATKAVLSRRAMRELLDGTPAAEEAAGPP
ncbi:hypothetical protein CHLNCDRAFT_135356 [Chlorella variabilis]|uniref:Uncharacterized protein n=1 Tax=Chlorella variabilis TaxID=554065 RepID=E1ZI19_CHLVA|nr:hypothetical protein CHLNCDRAFT_135356 [Chlorella variabilis]EFN54559.1 hypothetical protein CHLNCDRAFT_135356 [Chlorella variabilis]|eukprot:XP_005846661.1 hypothetical protein CHLNCDRAFT_135356 [Chlorella variabilis]